jgi:aspartyl/glutamyl-tRNA(Asn/Gln) amidotransferase C subunit
MTLNVDEVKRIATLARLRFTPEQEGTLTRQLGEIVAYIDQLRDFPDAEPGAAVAAPCEADDAVGDCLPREVLLANAPAATGLAGGFEGFIGVPEVKTDAGAGGDGG